MSDPILGGVEAVTGTLKDLVVTRIGEYLRFVNSYKDNMSELQKELNRLCAKKLDLDEEVRKGKKQEEVMTRETADWLENVIVVIKGDTMKKLMKEEGVAEIVVRVMEPLALKKLWQEDRELFIIVINAVKKKLSHRRAGDREVFRTDEEPDRDLFYDEERDRETSDEEGDRKVIYGKEDADADYKKVVEVVSDVMTDIAKECYKLVQSDDGGVAVVKLLDDENLKTLTTGYNETALILSKAEAVIRKNIIEHNDYDEEELLPTLNKGITKENVGIWRRDIRSLMSFRPAENFKKGLPEAADHSSTEVGLQIMAALSKSSASDPFETNGIKPHRYCGWRGLHLKVYRHQHDMSEIAEIMVKDIKSLISKYPLGSVTKKIEDGGVDNIPGEFADDLESREALLRRLLNTLNQDEVSIVGVFGMAGCGKTTLAKEIAQRSGRDLFDKRVLVEVSKATNIKEIQKQIAGGIGLTLNDMHTLAQRARILYNKLKKEKILIILDNVGKPLMLEEVGIPQEGSKGLYCKLLITTRERMIYRLMNVPAHNIFELGLLNEREAINLFQNQTGEMVRRGEFKLVADKLLRKCRGLPLAIVTTAGALRRKNLAMWCHFAEILENSISSQVSTEYLELYTILETSCKFLDTEENRIFLLLACLSSLDSAVTIDDLLKYGVGLDLFQRCNCLFEAMGQASTLAKELFSSSLLVPGDNGEVKIQDLVRASFISFIDKGKDHMALVESIPRWMCKETFEKLTAISLLSGHDFSRLSGVKAPMLQILFLKGDVSITTLNSDFFGGMKNIKVLSLSDMKFDLGLPETMGELERLQTLHLHHCKLQDIKVIGKLVNLLVLSLRESSLPELAVEIGELCNLRLLDVGGCKGVKSIPANILSRLSLLEGFYMLNDFDDWASTNTEADDGEGYKQVSGSELDKLSHLNVLEMEVSEIKQLLTVSNGQLVEQLSKFIIRVRNSYDWNMAEGSAFRYVLELKGIDASQENNWLRALLRKSESLLVMDCDRLTENIVPQLDEDGLKDLKHLHVQNCNVKVLVSSNEHDQSRTFANLELLRLASMNRLEMICDGKAPRKMFSNLQRLFLSGLTKLETGLVLTRIPFSLTEVSVEACVSLQFIFMKDAASVPENETDIIVFHFLKSLHLKHVGRLSSVVGQSHTVEHSQVDCHVLYAKGIFPSLENLKLQENRVIVTLWSKACDVSSVQNLKLLDISECDELTSLGPLSIFAALVQLEELTISRCAKLREVITKETEEHRVRKHVIVFRQLKHLSLENCTELETFYGGSHDLLFPLLKSLKLSCVPKLTTFDRTDHPTTLFSDEVQFPWLEELEVQRVSVDVARLWNSALTMRINPVPMLRKLSIGYVHGLMSIPLIVSGNLSHLEVMDFDDIQSLFSILLVNRDIFWTCSHFLKLENLQVQSCKFLELLFENEDDSDTAELCGNITGIMLKENPNLKMLPLHLLINIRTLTLCDLSWEYVFPGDLFKKGREQLQQLEILDIRKCKNIEVIILDEVDGDGKDKVYCFPRLKSLTLEWLDVVTNFSSKPNTGLLLPSLDNIELSHLYQIKSFCTGPFTARKLKEVKIEECCKMECFLSENISQVRELPSLESVHIRACSNIMAFAYEPLITPKLIHITLDNCSKMKWFLHGDPNQHDILDLPSLGSVSILWCDGMQSFSSGGIKAPNLCELELNNKDYSNCANKELQDLLLNLGKCHTAA